MQNRFKSRLSTTSLTLALTLKKPLLLPTAIITLLSGCTTVDQSDAITAMDARLGQLSQSQAIQTHSPVQLQEAEELAADTNAYWDIEQASDAELDHRIYVTQRAMDITEKYAELGVLKESLEAATSERTDLLLTARAAEAKRAKQSAQDSQAKLEALQSQLNNMQAKQTQRGIEITVEGVLFDFDKARLKPGGVRDIQRLAEYLQQHGDTKLQIEGHTDSRGSAEYNKQLAHQRAKAVELELTRLNIARDRIRVRSLGEEYPVASNHTAEGRQQNRRVEIILSQ